MLKLTTDTFMYIASSAVDRRKPINGLALLIANQFEMAPGHHIISFT